MSKLPLTIFHFPNLIQEGCTYVDKTQLLYRLIQEKPGAFLARPRRFGKSLLVSTLEALFEGRRELFKGLWIDSSDYEWKTYPIVRFDFSATVTTNAQTLEDSIHAVLRSTAKRYGIEMIDSPHATLVFTDLAEKLYQKIGPIVVLIDEYDHPLLDHIKNPIQADENRKFLKSFYTNIKAQERYLRYIFVTGVSQFTKVSLFSGFNNIQMISFRKEYADLLGLTEIEIRTYFPDRIRYVAEQRGVTETQVLELLKKWYNGYLFVKNNNALRVYNPLSVFKFLDTAELDNYWFETATPSLVLSLAEKRNFPLLDIEKDLYAGKELETAHDVGVIDLPVLLYQTGYLTIRQYDEETQVYVLGFPNEEVRRSFLEFLVGVFFKPDSPSDIQGTFYKLATHLRRHDLSGFFEVFDAFLDSIPNQIHKEAEGYYHSLLFLFLKTLGFKVTAEVSTAQGRIDMVLKTTNDIFIFEFKINKSADDALKQIHQKAYYTQFKLDKRPITLVGVNFDTHLRKITDWKQEKLPYKKTH